MHQLCEDKQSMLLPKELRFECDFVARTFLQGERFLLQQALSNLIDNAIAFSPRSGVITLKSEVIDRRWHFSVTDQGPGLPDYAESRVFERFYSLPRPDGSTRSSGLGLSFVQEVAQLHGGTASLNNCELGGATAYLSLPLHPVAVLAN